MEIVSKKYRVRKEKKNFSSLWIMALLHLFGSSENYFGKIFNLEVQKFLTTKSLV